MTPKRRGGRRGIYTAISRIGLRDAGYQHEGVLVCSGNMLETGKKDQKSPRKNHALILPRDERAKALKIGPQAINDYLNGLTPFQQEKLTDWAGPSGCLKDDAPVFYVPEGDDVRFFGHSPNFRIPAQLAMAGEARAANPSDFVPKSLRYNKEPDLVDAIFGWVEERDERDQSIGPEEKQRAGRVFFSDGCFIGDKDGVWLRTELITPHTLSGPSPTTFQHYLVQHVHAGQSDHNPDNKESLAHYGTPPDETQIRGYKLYWHKGSNPDIDATAKEREHEKQLTRIAPLKPGVRFAFKIYFENLRSEELGALWWALALPGESGKIYRHKLGMGKPLGMGAIVITPRLILTDRQERYKSLFKQEAWHEAARQADAESYLDKFENYLLQEKGLGSDKRHLFELERIQALLAMLEWREGTQEWLEKTRYMEIERGLNKINEFKERPVLPDSLGVISQPINYVKDKASVVSARRSSESVHKENQTSADQSQAAYVGGRVKWFNQQKGYGFIKPDKGGKDVFVHKNRLSKGLETLNENDRVLFQVNKGMKGLEAQDVRLEE